MKQEFNYNPKTEIHEGLKVLLIGIKNIIELNR